MKIERRRKERTINQVSNDDVSEQRRHAKNKTTQEPLMLAYQKFLRETSINCLSERDLHARFSHGVCLTLTIICAAPLPEQRHQLLVHEGHESEDLTLQPFSAVGEKPLNDFLLE